MVLEELQPDQVTPAGWLVLGVILFVLIVFSDGFRRFVGISLATALWIASALPVVWWLRDEFFLPPREYTLLELIGRGCGWFYCPFWVLFLGTFLIDWRERAKMQKQIEQAMEYNPPPAHGDIDFADDDDLRNGDVL